MSVPIFPSDYRMLNSFITYLQIFGIGFSFGLIGPCFLTCTPVLLTYIAGRKKGTAEVFKDIFTFLIRISQYPQRPKGKPGRDFGTHPQQKFLQILEKQSFMKISQLSGQQSLL